MTMTKQTETTEETHAWKNSKRSHFFTFMSIGWDVIWCPVSTITIPLSHKRPVSLDSDDEKAPE